ncbi:hypothetical protein ACFC1T_38255, partial [Kitasatospora sp. NPDC056076]|uniref:hypothetical protein n=1 Tax=Kitasatospora sp. NPDC056076 TaxID=3345703 RepID=UPI0035D68725
MAAALQGGDDVVELDRERAVLGGQALGGAALAETGGAADQQDVPGTVVGVHTVTLEEGGNRFRVPVDSMRVGKAGRPVSGAPRPGPRRPEAGPRSGPGA